MSTHTYAHTYTHTYIHTRAHVDIPKLYMQNITYINPSFSDPGYIQWQLDTVGQTDLSAIKMARPPEGNGVNQRGTLDRECRAYTGTYS